MSKAVVLLSGGLDSAVTAWVAKSEGNQIYALTFLYGQAHKKEVACAHELGWSLGVSEHKTVELPLNQIVGSYSSLFNKSEIPQSGLTKEVPSTWIPQRNAIFLAIAFAWAEVVGADKVYIGVNAVDYSGYPDCRLEFIRAMGVALRLASKQFVTTGSGIQICTPIIDKSKVEIVRLGAKLGVPYKSTWSCYKGEAFACSVCDSCRIRVEAFREAGLVDPVPYLV